MTRERSHPARGGWIEMLVVITATTSPFRPPPRPGDSFSTDTLTPRASGISCFFDDGYSGARLNLFGWQ